MMKAMYEFPAPKTCSECKLRVYKEAEPGWYCVVANSITVNIDRGLNGWNDKTDSHNSRAPYCPLIFYSGREEMV